MKAPRDQRKEMAEVWAECEDRRTVAYMSGMMAEDKDECEEEEEEVE
jgi:hypothetical protein